ncbi:MAG: hypothetical protein UZ11_BCD004000017 [Bacteroidetes bacterium OLB11]|nr:MAG: hypothetical protein UZ11_BCD004000017 [Bacteroidetes bacterium OLB11]
MCKNILSFTPSIFQRNSKISLRNGSILNKFQLMAQIITLHYNYTLTKTLDICVYFNALLQIFL